MKKGSIQVMMGIFFIILVAGFVFLYATGWEWPETGTIFENKKLVYPLYSSVCCEARNFGDWDRASITDIRSFEQSYTCPSSTTQCRVRSPQIQCPGIGWTHPLGTSPVWVIEVTNPGDYVPSQYCNSLFCNQLSVPKEFGPSGTVRYQGACIDNTVYLSPTGIFSLYNMLAGPTVTPTYGHIDVEFVHTELWRYPAMEGSYSIPNSVLCTKNSDVMTLIKNNPTNPSKADDAKEIVEQLQGIDLDPAKAYEGILSESIFPMKPSECYLTVDKWIDLPYWGNVNPLGQYNNQDVICSPSKGLIKIEKISTQGGTQYYVPTKRLEQPTLFCCNHADCQAFGSGYNCIGYSCELGEGYCTSDLECQPQGGEKVDDNCYRDRSSGQFFEWDTGCNRLTNTCNPPNKEEVACCPSYCSQYGQWCNKDKGCQDPIVPKPDCPPEMCCDGVTHQKQGCQANLQCCPTADPHMGVCNTQCEDEVCPPIMILGFIPFPDIICLLQNFINGIIEFIQQIISFIMSFILILFVIVLIVFIIMMYLIFGR